MSPRCNVRKVACFLGNGRPAQCSSENVGIGGSGYVRPNMAKRGKEADGY